jgi:hypothetical protein
VKIYVGNKPHGYQPEGPPTDSKNPPQGSGVPVEKVVKSYCFDSEMNGEIDEHKHSILAILDFLIELDKKIIYHAGHRFGRGLVGSELQEDIKSLKESILRRG